MATNIFEAWIDAYDKKKWTKNEYPYKKYLQVLNDAFIQVSAGKGNERHVDYQDEAFEHQVICEINRRLGCGGGGALFQAVKKIYESQRLSPEKAKHELLGAINYLVAAIILVEEGRVHDCERNGNRESISN